MASIISINISAAKGEKKKPVDGAELKAGHGIVGDVHAGDWHRQVSLLASESIESMRAKGLDVGPGDFAENLTTEGIDLPVLKPGTRLRLGSALVEVTQIGKKCHSRCEIFRQAGDCVMPREGIFVRVLEGGGIRAGDAVEMAVEAAQVSAESRSESGSEVGTHTEQGFADLASAGFTAAVVTVSDSRFRGESGQEGNDESGDVLEKLLSGAGATEVTRVLVPDDRERIAAALKAMSDDNKAGLILTTGGTGVAPGDVTPEATRDVIEREAPGFSEAIRAGSMSITPRAMLSRAASGIRGGSLIINLPGSPRACAESFEMIRPVLGHALELLAGEGRHCARP